MMKYIGSNGVQTGSGGMNFGSGIGEIPQSAIANLSGLGETFTGSGMLGSFGQMSNSFGLGQQAAPEVTGPTPEQIAQQAMQAEQARLAAESAGKKKMLKYGLIAGGALLVGYFLFRASKPKRAGIGL